MLIVAILAFMFSCLIFILALSFIIFLTSSFIHLFPKNSYFRIFALFSSGIILFFTVRYVLGDILSMLVWNPTASEKNEVMLLSFLFSIAVVKINYDYFIKNKIISMKTNAYLGILGLFILSSCLSSLNNLVLLFLGCLISSVSLALVSYPFLFRIKDEILENGR